METDIDDETEPRDRRTESTVKRRTVLRSVGVGGVAGIAGVAGCLGGNGNGDGTVGTASITFLGETHSFDDASCEGSRTFPPENQQIHYRDYGEEFEFWVERYDPAESDVVEVHVAFTSSSSQRIGEIEAYEGETTADEVEFELGSHTSGSVELVPSGNMNDDVEHNPDGGVVDWDISCRS